MSGRARSNPARLAMGGIAPFIRAHLLWLCILGALSFLYAPSFHDLITGIWRSDQQAHGPIVAGVSLWLVVRKWPSFWRLPGQHDDRALGAAVTLVGMVAFALGRSQGVYLLEIGSLVWVLAGIAISAKGRKALSVMAFPLFFMLFMIPLPASLVDAVTQPMKMVVSYISEHVLYWAGYPVARSGVILTIGQYKLLVADACAGLHSLFTLEALGLLYMNVVRHPSLARNLVLAITIVPISITANVIRVMTLVLITYYLGDDAGQGFLHDFSGMVLFLSALALITAIDAVIGRVMGDERKSRQSGVPSSRDRIQAEADRDASGAHEDAPRIHAGATAMFVALVVVAMVGSIALRPQTTPGAAIPDLERLVPAQVAGWRQLQSAAIQVNLAVTEGDRVTNTPYDRVLMRTYGNEQGVQVMLALAYAADQKQDVKIHRPEVCYVAQGFNTLHLAPQSFQINADAPPIPGTRLLVSERNRLEAVSYWIRIGDQYTNNPWLTRAYIFTEGLKGRSTDGMLVRVSTLITTDTEADEAYVRQERFMAELVASVSEQQRTYLVSGKG
tara:strand:+ start:28351 stop:30027 length:1677 start_codon:yes stop_codon:yes gene_type:complete